MNATNVISRHRSH